MMFETIHMHYAYRVWMMTYRLYAIYAGRLCLNTSSISTYTHSTRSIHIHHTYEPSIYRYAVETLCTSRQWLESMQMDIESMQMDIESMQMDIESMDIDI